MTKIFLKRGKEESLGRRHPWVFSGAIERMEGEPAEGDVVDVYSRQGEFLARGHYQIGSITVRILTFVQEEIDARWWLERLRAAVGVRRAVGLVGNPMTDCYRLVHGEGDGLPGLVVDIYGDTAVVQAHSVGMYRSRDAVCDALRRVYGGALAAVYDKSAQTLPYKADTGACDGYLYGGDGTTERIVTENGNRFHVDCGAGQKTGFFLDQRETGNSSGVTAAGVPYSIRSVIPAVSPYTLWRAGRNGSYRWTARPVPSASRSGMSRSISATAHRTRGWRSMRSIT